MPLGALEDSGSCVQDATARAPNAAAAATRPRLLVEAASGAADVENLTYLPLSCPCILVDTIGGRRRLPVNRVVRVTAEGDYIRIHTAERSYMLRATLVEAARELAGHGFVRIHRRALVNEAHVERRRRAEDGRLRVVLSDGTEAPVGRKFASSQAIRRSSTAT